MSRLVARSYSSCLSVDSDASADAMLSAVVPPANGRLVGTPVVPKPLPAPLRSQFVRIIITSLCCLCCLQFGAQRLLSRLVRHVAGVG